MLFWTAVVVAAAALAGGSWFAVVAYRATSGPDGAVRGYFAALARGDASAALAFGGLPDGTHAWLTDAVLRAQLDVARIEDVSIGRVSETGADASVAYSYQLRFPGRSQQVTGTIALHDGGDGWRLARVASATTVDIDGANDRVDLAGAQVPDDAVVLFPGALPVGFDTPYLQADPATAFVSLEAQPSTEVSVEPTPAARRRLATLATQQLARCLAGRAPAAACPEPTTRVVPGSLRGRVVGTRQQQAFAVSSSAAGTISVTGSVTVAGSYTALSYDNVARRHSGRFTLAYLATSPPTAPLALTFQDAP